MTTEQRQTITLAPTYFALHDANTGELIAEFPTLAKAEGEQRYQADRWDGKNRRTIIVARR